MADEAVERAEQKKAQLARQKAARKPTERVRVDRALRMDVRADRVQLPERRQSDSESVESKRVRGKKERAGVSTRTRRSSHQVQVTRLRRSRRVSRRVDKAKRKTRGRDRLAGMSSESEPELDARGARGPRVDDDGIRAGKTLRSWKFSGRATKKAAEEFLDQLDACREGNQLSDAGMLGALPCVFTAEAATWFRLEKLRINS